jgi:hypothetical protein
MAAAADPGPVATGEGEGSSEMLGEPVGDPIVMVHAAAANARATTPAASLHLMFTGVAG